VKKSSHISFIGSGLAPEGSRWEKSPVSRPWGFSRQGPLVRESLHLRINTVIVMYTVYVLKSDIKNFHYIGHSKDVAIRLKAHNAGKVRSTKAYRPLVVIYTESYSTKSAAARREYFLKTAPGNIWLRNKLQTAGVW